MRSLILACLIVTIVGGFALLSGCGAHKQDVCYNSAGSPAPCIQVYNDQWLKRHHQR